MISYKESVKNKKLTEYVNKRQVPFNKKESYGHIKVLGYVNGSPIGNFDGRYSLNKTSEEAERDGDVD